MELELKQNEGFVLKLGEIRYHIVHWGGGFPPGTIYTEIIGDETMTVRT